MKPSSLGYLVLLFAAISSNTNAEIVPADFPTAASYDCVLFTTNASSLCAECTFFGRHHFSVASNDGYVQWMYGTSVADVSTYVNFLDVFRGDENLMYMVQDVNSKALCLELPYEDPLFNLTWSAEAVFEGHQWYDGRLTRKFGNVYPFFIQGEVAVSTYYEDVFTSLPVAFVNVYASLVYKTDTFRVSEPDEAYFTAVETLRCVTPPAGTERKGRLLG
jgi:hypothetical protein